MIYGYCRISRDRQNMERQIRNIETSFPEAKIIKEVYTGRSLSRPEWDRLYRNLHADDTVIFDSVSRMSRDADEGFNTYEKLFNRGVNLIFLKESHIDTCVYREKLAARINEIDAGGGAAQELVNAIINALNAYTMELAREQIRLAFEQAQKEVDDLRQRTREGIETARRNGKRIGGYTATEHKAEKPIKEIIRAKSRDFNGNNTDVEVMAIIRSTQYTDQRTGVTRCYTIARGTYYKYKAKLAEELAAEIENS